MASGDHLIKCKSCAVVLAAVTPIGLTPVPLPVESGCSTCQRFSTLYDAVQAADAEWATFENKRDSITRSFARDKHKKARMEFDNWLMTVEAPPISRAEERVTAIPEVQDLFHGNEESHPNITRRRSHSPTIQYSGITKELSNPRPQQQGGALLSFRPSLKRSRSTNSMPGRKQLKFSDTVKFHETYRSSDEYHRSSELYVRGRNAPPEGSEYMDTSGSGQTFLRFTQTKKVGAKWVELSEEELAKKSKSPGPTPAQRQLGVIESQEAKGDCALEQNTEVPSDARAARLARRAKEASSMSSAQVKNTRRVGNRNSKIVRKVEVPLVDGTPAGIEEPSAEPDPPSSTSALEEARLTTDEGLDTPKEIGVGHERVGKASIATTIEKASIETMRNDEIREPESYHRRLHLDAHDSGTVADQNESIQRDTQIMETGSSSAVAQNQPKNGPAIQPSCIHWEDAYSSAPRDGQNVAAVRVDQYPRAQIEMN